MQTDRRTRTYYPRRPTEVGAGNNNNNNKEEEEEENYVQIQSFAADRNKLQNLAWYTAGGDKLAASVVDADDALAVFTA